MAQVVKQAVRLGCSAPPSARPERRKTSDLPVLVPHALDDLLTHRRCPLRRELALAKQPANKPEPPSNPTDGPAAADAERCRGHLRAVVLVRPHGVLLRPLDLLHLPRRTGSHRAAEDRKEGPAEQVALEPKWLRIVIIFIFIIITIISVIVMGIILAIIIFFDIIILFVVMLG